MKSAFGELELRLLSSLGEVITPSIGSLKASIESEIRSLHTKIDELTERIQQLEEERSNPNIPTQSMDPSTHQP